MTGAGEAEVSHHHLTTGFSALVEEGSLAGEPIGEPASRE